MTGRQKSGGWDDRSESCADYHTSHGHHRISKVLGMHIHHDSMRDCGRVTMARMHMHRYGVASEF